MSGTNKKSVLGMVLLAGVESTYGAGVSLTGSVNAIQLAMDFPMFNIEYANAGERKRGQMSTGQLPRVSPTGQTIAGKVKIEMKGDGTGSYVGGQGGAPNAHPFLLACGLTGSYVSNGYAYTPMPLGTAPLSAGLQLYEFGGSGPVWELWNVSGSVGTFTITAADTGIAYAEFDMKGLPSTGSEVNAVTPHTFDAVGVAPPAIEGMTFTIGTYSGSIVRKFDYGHAQETSPRLNLQASKGHAGFAFGQHMPVLKVTLEADVMAAFDPYSLYSNAATFPVTASVGSTGNGWALYLKNVQVTKVTRAADNSVATWDLELMPSITTPDSNDDMTLLFF